MEKVIASVVASACSLIVIRRELSFWRRKSFLILLQRKLRCPLISPHRATGGVRDSLPVQAEALLLLLAATGTS